QSRHPKFFMARAAAPRFSALRGRRRTKRRGGMVGARTLPELREVRGVAEVLFRKAPPCKQALSYPAGRGAQRRKLPRTTGSVPPRRTGPRRSLRTGGRPDVNLGN